MSGSCPCCMQPVAAPSLDDVIAACRLDGFEAAILGTVWAGKGTAVQALKIFDAMYADDPDGGPSPTRMYAAFRHALSSLNSKIEDMGIAVRSIGRRKGWRISFDLRPS